MMVEVAKLVYEIDTTNAVAALDALTVAAERAAEAVRSIGENKDQMVEINLIGSDGWLKEFTAEVVSQIPNVRIRGQ